MTWQRPVPIIGDQTSAAERAAEVGAWAFPDLVREGFYGRSSPRGRDRYHRSDRPLARPGVAGRRPCRRAPLSLTPRPNGEPLPTDELSTGRHAARGALPGAACGDALGAPFEGSRAVSQILVENWMTSARTMRYTDNTAMTVVLARHLITSGGMIEEGRLARDFAEEWQAEPDRGYGAGLRGSSTRPDR